MTIEQMLFDTAVVLIEQRYPVGWGGAAVMRTSAGRILSSVAPETRNDALALCMEVGAILEAHKFGEAISHSVCVCRESADGPWLILTPCGICQERLLHWGGGVQVAVSNAQHLLLMKPLRELMPFHWSQVNGDVL